MKLIDILVVLILFIFNKISYVITNIIVILSFFHYYGASGIAAYLCIGLLISPSIINIDFGRQKAIFEQEVGKYKWYYYIPFFLFDVIAWVYTVMGLTCDLIIKKQAD